MPPDTRVQSSREGTLLSTPVALMETPPRQAACLDCDWDDLPRVRFFLHVYRQAYLYREPFADVLRHRTRNSRSIDPAVRGQGFDWDRARAIGWSLDAVVQRKGWGFMHPDNAESVSLELCPGRAR
jgi:hypothetical protein